MARLTHQGAGDVVRALDELLDERITRMMADLRRALDPDTAPLSLLPWLAWSAGLTHWSSDWPEATQRRVLREARQILRERGQRQGIERQLGALGASVLIREWWEDDPEGTPGTWRAVVTAVLGAETDLEAQEQIEAAIRRTAPLARPWTIDVGVSGASSNLVRVHLRAAARAHVTATTELVIPP